MAGNLQVPEGVARTVEIDVKHTNDALRLFLVNVANELKLHQEQITALEERIVALGG